ncbi:MAG: DUF4239 domain-containing protein [Alphaproteobacteria bacterium]|nr:DUF4239 domain-containing protein [Alphaproteobacteria bacterium]
MLHLYYKIMNSISSDLFIFLFIIGAACIVTTIFFIIKYFVPEVQTPQNRKFLSMIINITTAIYAFLLGLSIITLWQDFERAQMIVNTEAGQLALMLSDSQAFSPPVQHSIVNGISKYIYEVIPHEWETMRWGQLEALSKDSLSDFFTILQTYTPENEMQKIFYTDFVGHLNSAIENRRHRLDHLNSGLILPLRIVLICGVLLLCFFFSLYKSRDAYTQLLTVVTISTLLSFTVSIGLLLDYPFAGDMSVSPKAFYEGSLSLLPKT